MVKTTKKQIKKSQNKSSNVKTKKVEVQKQNKAACFKCRPCLKGNIALKIFFLSVYTFVILLFLTMWSKLYNKQALKEEKCLVYKLYCCGYDNKKECENWQKTCRENETEKLNCDLGK